VCGGFNLRSDLVLEEFFQLKEEDLVDLVLELLHDAHLRDVARRAGLDDAGLAGEGVAALAGLASLALLGHELADAVEHEQLALLHLVVDELQEGLVDPLAGLALDTRDVLESLGDLALRHGLALRGSGFLAAGVDANILFVDLGSLGCLGSLGNLALLGGALLLGRALDALLGGALAGATLLHDGGHIDD